MYTVPRYTCSLLLIISKTVGLHQTVSSCWLNLHVTRYSVKPLSYLEPQSFLFSVHLSPQERPWTSVPFHLPFTRDYVSQKDSFWERWLLPPELRLLGLNDDGTLSEAFQKAAPGAAVLMGLLGGKNPALVGNGAAQFASLPRLECREASEDLMCRQGTVVCFPGGFVSAFLFPVARPDNQNLTVSCHWILEALPFQLDVCLFLLLWNPKVKVGFNLKLFNSIDKYLL